MRKKEKKVEPIDLPKSARVGDSFIGITNMHTPYLNCILSIAKNDKNLSFEDIFCQKQVQHVESLRSLASHARYLFLLTLFSAGFLLTHKQLH